jgi:hypothetical protein
MTKEEVEAAIKAHVASNKKAEAKATEVQAPAEVDAPF